MNVVRANRLISETEKWFIPRRAALQNTYTGAELDLTYFQPPSKDQHKYTLTYLLYSNIHTLATCAPPRFRYETRQVRHTLVSPSTSSNSCSSRLVFFAVSWLDEEAMKILFYCFRIQAFGKEVNKIFKLTILNDGWLWHRWKIQEKLITVNES